MSLLSENVIPGNHGKNFTTNAKKDQDLEKIKSKVLSIDGVKDFILNTELHPNEFTIHTDKLVKIQDIENAVNDLGFHAFPKDVFEL